MGAVFRRITILVALAVGGPGLFLSAAAETVQDLTSIKVQAEGFAEGRGRSAEAAALADAERAAVDLAAFDIAGERWVDALDAVFAQRGLYVRTSRPLDTFREGEGVRVRAEVYVYTGQLRRDIAAVLFDAFPSKPVVAVLFGESIDGYRGWTVGEGAAQRFFVDRFGEAGFVVADSGSKYTSEALMEYQAGTSRQIAGFGRDVRADLVLRGDVTAELEPQEGAVNVNRVLAKIDLDLIRPADAVVVERFESAAAVNSPNPRMGGEQAIDDAAGKIVQEVLVSAVLAYASQPPSSDFVVSVRLPASGPWLTRARNGIRERFPKAQLEDLYHAPGEARFRITLDAPLSKLVHGLTDRSFEDFQLATQRAVGRELDLELIPLGY